MTSNPVKDQIRSKVWNKLWSQMRWETSEAVCNLVWHQVGDPLREREWLMVNPVLRQLDER